MTSKIRIKMGAIEVEYEGSEEFLKTELPELLTAVSELYNKAKETEQEGEEETGTAAGGPHSGGSTLGTTTSIAAKLKSDSGPDLALAAAARLVLGLKQDSFTRQELLKEMQSARSYYSKSMSGNLTKILDGLVKGDKFNEVSKDRYSLAQSERSRIEAQLANP